MQLIFGWRKMTFDGRQEPYIDMSFNGRQPLMKTNFMRENLREKTIIKGKTPDGGRQSSMSGMW